MPRGNRGGGRFQGGDRGYDEAGNQYHQKDKVPQEEQKGDSVTNQKDGSAEVETSVNNNTQIVVNDTQGGLGWRKQWP